jgi:hypothetical protein
MRLTRDGITQKVDQDAILRLSRSVHPGASIHEHVGAIRHVVGQARRRHLDADRRLKPICFEVIRLALRCALHRIAAAMGAYAKKAANRNMEADAFELRLRAERRLGQMMAAQKRTVGFAKGGGDKRSKHRVSQKALNQHRCPPVHHTNVGKYVRFPT